MGFLHVFVLALACVASAEVVSVNSWNIGELSANASVFVKLARRLYVTWCGHCEAMSPEWEKYSEDSDGVIVGDVNCEVEKALCQAYAVASYPTLIFIHEKRIYKFDRPRTAADFKRFAAEHYLQSTTLSDDQPVVVPTGKRPAQIKRVAGGAPAPGQVVVLTDASFKSSVASGVWLVAFHAPWCGHCKQLAQKWGPLAAKATDFNVAKVDCTTEKTVCTAFGIRGYPTIKVVTGGSHYDYAGPREEAAFTAFATGGYKAASASPVPANI